MSATTAGPATVTATRRGAATWIEWDNGERNLLDLEVTRALVRVLREADEDPEAAVIVLAGSARAFCGGADLAKLKATGTAREFAAEVVGLLGLLPLLRKPVLAAVRGDALASGFSLVLLADAAVAAEDAVLGTVEVAGGGWPMIAQVPVRHLLPAKAATYNLVTGLPFTAARLAELGVLAATATADEVDARTRELAEAAARSGALAATGRRALAELSVNAGYAADLDAALAHFVAMLEPKEGAA
ncbi:enoyl-CoA hydratase/isomerase family protein [Streptomyces tagetis]|uniref:Enoyl-CoA hydratase/isomerase family protein n=1 Tax=Streptomyces tagetis TaxID=2820809 RepID=A0A941AYN6_9ACTN|nr:enoyl-CoA hydratase/isomerase family protein [Streptomyces sp. RG38]MBQ0825250.1 enoyl-CoA hydratase/isomerase family protein [Streptomyces sp. RG38]